MEVLDDGVKVEGLELLGVVELLVHRIGQGRVPVKNFQVQLVRPPVCVRRYPGHRGSAARHWALGFRLHSSLRFWLCVIRSERVTRRRHRSRSTLGLSRKLAMRPPSAICSKKASVTTIVFVIK